jgi:ABC-2 type transport system permease protein
MANVLETIYTLWLREILRFIKSRSRVVGSGGQPLIWLAIIGVGFGSAFTFASGQSVPYITFMAPGIICMTILFSSIFSGVNVLWDKQFGFLKEILVTPVPRVGIVLGKIAGSTTVSLLSALVVLAIIVIAGVIPLGDLNIGGLVVAVLFMMIVSSIFVAIGLIIASTISSIEGYNVVINFLVLPVFFLSGALFPLSNAPLWMKALAAIDPMLYGVDGMRGALIGLHNTPIYLDFAAVLAIAVFFIAIADIAFSRIQSK